MDGFELNHENVIYNEKSEKIKKGIWIWSEPIKFEDKYIILLDC